MVTGDINNFPTAEEARGGGLTLGNAIFELEMQTCFVSILDAIRQGKKEVTLSLFCAGMIMPFLKEKGYQVEVVVLTAAESRMRKYRNSTCVKVSWE